MKVYKVLDTFFIRSEITYSQYHNTPLNDNKIPNHFDINSTIEYKIFLDKSNPHCDWVNIWKKGNDYSTWDSRTQDYAKLNTIREVIDDLI